MHTENIFNNLWNDNDMKRCFFRETIDAIPQPRFIYNFLLSSLNMHV